MDMTLIVSFPGTEQTTLAEVGGKGYSLIRMVEAGLPVPPGAVLTTEFFAPWFDEIQGSATWTALADATPDKWPTLCNELKGLCPALPLTATQRQALEDLRKNLAALGDDVLFAVRSSSPEEDLASASFAGGYETRLGVRPAGLDDAVRHCFASSLDERVLVYKNEHGLDVLSPRIAVVVQQQIDSEVAGVGFSLNPLTNDYDEAVIDANWGQGESVVAGLVSPDHFVVDKVGREVIERKRGAKLVSIWLEADGGTSERRDHRSNECTLDDAQLDELTDVIVRIEALYGLPMDIEWAFAGGRLFVLQARPITAYVPLPTEMLTRPGERRVLYTDIALSSGLTINAPISPMGLAWMEEGIECLVEFAVGRIDLDLPFEEGLWFIAGSRMYQNLSNAMWLASPQKMAKASEAGDPLMSAILADVDVNRYRAPVRPSWARLRMLRFLPRVLWRTRRVFGNTLWALLAPERARRTYQRRVDAHDAVFSAALDFDLPFGEFRRKYSGPKMRHLLDVTMPALAVGLVALGLVDRAAGARRSAAAKALADKLKLGFDGNVVVEMGIALFRMAALLDPSEPADLDRLVERVEQRAMPAEFLSAWDSFLSTYGWRGPMEMDLASPRYADDIRLALRQMSLMAVGDADFDPEVAHQRLVDDRRRAFEELMSRSGWLRRALLRRIHRIIDLFAGTRDTPKHANLSLYYAVRRRALTEGRRLVDEGRLDAPEHVFDLTFDDLESAARQPALNLRELRAERTHFFARLAAQVSGFPPVIDSRGRILRPPPRAEKPGELTGTAVSPGVATGPVKRLHTPDEKPVEKGDVLVAQTTDPGWTPLFVNAAAVVLEVGGVLQHGAVVAREYGKPCVAGIDGVMTRLHDGQCVEVDGTAGVVRVVSQVGHDETAESSRCVDRHP